MDVKAAALAMAVAAAIFAIPAAAMEAAGEPYISAEHLEGRTYLFSFGSGTVTWDFGDGTVVISTEPVAHSFASSGVQRISATKDGVMHLASVTVTDDAPVTRAYTGTEYRYAPAGSEISAEVSDPETGDPVSWIAWDPALKCVRGTPPGSAAGSKCMVRVVVDGAAHTFDLSVVQGSSPSISAAFTAETDGLRAKASPVMPMDYALYYWSVYDMAGTKVLVSNEMSPTLAVGSAGSYVVRLKVVAQGGIAEYSSVVHFGQERADEQTGIGASDVLIVAGIAIALIVIARFVI